VGDFVDEAARFVSFSVQVEVGKEQLTIPSR
jgi:hypothetical protein